MPTRATRIYDIIHIQPHPHVCVQNNSVLFDGASPYAYTLYRIPVCIHGIYTAVVVGTCSVVVACTSAMGTVCTQISVDGGGGVVLLLYDENVFVMI